MNKAIKRELRNAVRVVTNADQFTESQVKLSWRMLKQHGVPQS
jgi:hypothetical protein